MTTTRAFLIGCVALFALGACAGADDSATRAEGLTDDPCGSSSQCDAPNAVCVDIGDGVRRCETRCLRDADCSYDAHCLFGPDDEVGLCFRLCDTGEDCAVGNWLCEPITDSPQGYCVM